MNAPKSLPGTMTVLAYLAAGSALSCSFFMMHQVFSMQAGLGSELLGWLLPAAILFSGAVLWRLAGHLHHRGMIGALLIVAPSAVLLEAGSIATSFMSTNLAVEQRRIDDRQASDSYRATQQATHAAGIAAQRLAANLAEMPDRYVTLGNKTANQLQELMDSQRRLMAAQAEAAGQGSAVSSVIDRRMQTWWAAAIALALSISVLAVQFGLGATSDGAQRQRHGLDITDSGVTSGPGNVPSLRSA